MRIRAHNLSILYLLILAFSFNAVAPAFAYSSIGDTPNNRVLLCTSQGYQWVTLDERIEQNTSSETSTSHCVLCIGGDNVADSALLTSLDFNYLFASAEPLELTDHYPRLQSLFIAQLADTRAPPQN